MKRQEEVEKILQKISLEKGYLSEDEIVEICIDYNLDILETALVCDNLLNQKIFVTEFHKTSYSENFLMKQFIDCLQENYSNKKCYQIVTAIEELQNYIEKKEISDVNIFVETNANVIEQYINDVQDVLVHFKRKRSLINNALYSYLKIAKSANEFQDIQQNPFFSLDSNHNISKMPLHKCEGDIESQVGLKNLQDKEQQEKIVDQFTQWLKKNRFLDKAIVKYISALNEYNEMAVSDNYCSIYGSMKLVHFNSAISHYEKDLHSVNHKTAVKYYRIFLKEFEESNTF